MIKYSFIVFDEHKEMSSFSFGLPQTFEHHFKELLFVLFTTWKKMKTQSWKKYHLLIYPFSPTQFQFFFFVFIKINTYFIHLNTVTYMPHLHSIHFHINCDLVSIFCFFILYLNYRDRYFLDVKSLTLLMIILILMKNL